MLSIFLKKSGLFILLLGLYCFSPNNFAAYSAMTPANGFKTNNYTAPSQVTVNVLHVAWRGGSLSPGGGPATTYERCSSRSGKPFGHKMYYVANAYSGGYVETYKCQETFLTTDLSYTSLKDTAWITGPLSSGTQLFGPPANTVTLPTYCPAGEWCTIQFEEAPIVTLVVDVSPSYQDGGLHWVLPVNMLVSTVGAVNNLWSAPSCGSYPPPWNYQACIKGVISLSYWVGPHWPPQAGDYPPPFGAFTGMNIVAYGGAHDENGNNWWWYCSPAGQGNNQQTFSMSYPITQERYGKSCTLSCNNFHWTGSRWENYLATLACSP